VTILESKEREKGSNNDSESSLERETEVGMEAETEAAFSVFEAVFSVKRTGDSVFLWERGITVFNGITGTDRLCSEGPGQDDESRGGNAALRTKSGWMV
jgi:hypothetical protein